jgi:RES domain
VCFLEAVLRDQRDGVVGEIEIEEAEITDRLYSEIAIGRALKLVDLRSDLPVKMGIPSDVVRGRTQTLARKWSLAIYEHPAAVDGIIYPSRLSTEVNLAVYDRAVSKLTPRSTGPLEKAPNIGRLLTDFQVALV